MKLFSKKIIVTAFLLLLAANSSYAQDWPMFRANGNRTGSIGTSDSKTSFTGAKDWTVKLPDAIQSSPAIYGTLAIMGSNDGSIYALDIRNGDIVWTFHTGNWVASSPAVVDGKLFVGSYDGKMYCINAATG